MYSGTFINDLLDLVDRTMPRTGDALLDLAQGKAILADRRPMSSVDIVHWELLDRVQRDVIGLPIGEPRRITGKLISIATTRGRKVLVPPEDLEIKLGADGLVRAYSDFGPIVERVLPACQAVDIASGEFPEYAEE